MASAEGVGLDPGRIEWLELPNAEDFEQCVERLRDLTPEVEKWLSRGRAAEIVVDFTGGTKCMSAALALVASRWPCRFSYVGGNERTDDGVGIVVNGKETIVHQANPWEAMGYRAAEEFVVLFGRGAFEAAARLAEETKQRVFDGRRKREFSALEQLARAFEAWDRFDPVNSRKAFANVYKAANDLTAFFGREVVLNLTSAVGHIERHLQALCASAPPSRHHVIDLLANARRRMGEGRYDDAVARMYRAVEALAQVALKERHGIERTEAVPPGRLPERMREQLARKNPEEPLKLGLQRAYELLDYLEDPLGETFRTLGLDGHTSPLVARNRSILAHGFERVSEKTAKRLWSAALSLAQVEGIDETDLPSFPSLQTGPRR